MEEQWAWALAVLFATGLAAWQCEEDPITWPLVFVWWIAVMAIRWVLGMALAMLGV